MAFPATFIDQVRKSTDLVDLVAQYVELRRSGGEYRGLCPFHEDTTPSFSVSAEKQVYFCFGCHAKGDAFTFLQQHRGMTFPESVEYLAEQAGLPLPADAVSGNARATEERQQLYDVNLAAARFYHDTLKGLPKTHPAKAYLKARGVSDEIIDRFQLGYAPDSWTALSDHLGEDRLPAARKLGLVRAKRDGQGEYDLFRDRIIFPIFSPTEHCLGFGGRALNDEQQPKYLNSADSVIFQKGRLFYGLDHAAKHIRGHDTVLIVEGYLDYLSLVKEGFTNTVAALGTALTREHARVIKRYTRRAVLLFDGDEGGKHAARRSLDMLLGEGLFVRGAFLPEAMDPDEFLRAHDREELEDLIRTAPDLFDLVTEDAWSTSLRVPSEKILFLDEFAPVLAHAADQRLARLYADNLSRLLDIDPRIVEDSLKQARPEATPEEPEYAVEFTYRQDRGTEIRPQ